MSDTDEPPLHPEPDPQPEADEPRRYPSTVGGALYLLAMAAVAAGVGITVLDGWRTGVRWISGGLVFAAVCRLLLPSAQAGMLAVRRRWIDVVMLAGVGALLLLLAGSIPNQPL